MESRVDLHKNLVDILGSNKVFFNPPESLKLTYPCIRYTLNGIRKVNADDGMYKNDRSYAITLIHKDPDNDIVDKILALPMCSFQRSYVYDNLYHFSFVIYI